MLLQKIKLLQSIGHARHGNMTETINVTDARLTTHEQVCTERYKAVEQKFKAVNHRFDKIERDLKDMRETQDKHFTELKELMFRSRSDKFKIMVTTAGSIIVALIGLIGYLAIGL